MAFSTGALAFPEPSEDILNTAQPAYYEIEGPYRLTNDDQRSQNPSVLIDDDDNMHVIWDDSRNDPDPYDTAYIHEIFYKKLDRNGNVLVNDTRLNDNTGIDALPGRWYTPGSTAALDSDGDIHIAYLEFTRHKYASNNQINVEIYYMKIDGGLDKSGGSAARSEIVLVDEQRVSEGAAFSGDADLALDSDGNVHIVWYDHRSAWYNWEIYYEKLDNDGNRLIDDKRLTYYMDYNAGPELVVDTEDDLHIVFKNYIYSTGVNSVYYMKTDSDGDTIVFPKKIATEGVNSYMLYSNSYPGIAIDSSDDLHVAWNDFRDGNDQDVFYLKLDSDGDPLMTSPMAITSNAADSYGGAVAVDNNDRVLISYRDDMTGYGQLYLAILNSDGSYHLQPYQLTTSESLSSSPAFGFDSDGNTHIVFSDTITWDPELYHIILKPTLMELGFVAYGLLGSRLDITIYEDDVEIASGTIIRASSDPKDDIYSVELEINIYASYDVEIVYTPTAGKGKSNAALNLKIYLMDSGELSGVLGNIVFKSNPSKNSQTTATYNLDNDIAEYF